MSCRTTAAGSAVTTFAHHWYGLADSQCTSLFHQLRSEWRRLSQSARDMAVGSGDLESSYRRNLRTLRDMARDESNGMSERLRARSIERFDRALGEGNPSPEVMWAVANVRHGAERAQTMINATIATIARDLGVRKEIVESEFWHLVSDYDSSLRSEALRFPRAADLAERMGGSPMVMPDDPATRWALGTLLSTYVCSLCHRFVPHHGTHDCPVVPLYAHAAVWANDPSDELDSLREYVHDYVRRHAAPVSPASRIAASRSETPAEVPDPLPSPVAVPVPDPVPVISGPRAPISMEKFQEEYDEARNALAEGKPVPTDRHAEATGTVTGGLGSRDGGTSFGLEIEMDFPDDPYPYQARQNFAAQLHEEGIVVSPFVRNWHSVGDSRESRPGGTYIQSAGDWVCEYDRTVDDVDGARGVEIKSQIMFDEPQAWANLRRIMEVAEQHGGRATPRTGLHVNIGASAFAIGEVEQPLRLLEMAAAYDDVLLRLANNPSAGSSLHRGRTFCTPVIGEGERQETVSNAVSGYRSHAMHRNTINLSHMSFRGMRRHSSDSRIEGRIFDGAVSAADVGRIQAAVTVHLALVRAAVEMRDPGQQAQPGGTQRGRFGRRRLAGEEWEESTLPMRNFVALMDEVAGDNSLFRKQIQHMFAASRWQENRFDTYDSNGGDWNDDDDDDDY